MISKKQWVGNRVSGKEAEAQGPAAGQQRDMMS